MLSKVGYYLGIKPLSYLPFRALYILSDLLYHILYKCFGYRKKVVWDNLRRSFPDKSEKDLKLLMNAFYRHFFDLVVESIKLFSISNEEIIRRCKFMNPELLDREFDRGQSVILVGGHYNNWEILAVSINQQCKHHQVGIYMPLTSPFYDKVVRESRSKYGLRMLPVKEVASYFANESAQLTSTIFGADQSPTNTKKVFWTNFLNQETAVAAGVERYARQYNYPVYYGRINKISRGHYTFEVSLITDSPQSTPDGEITLKHVRVLENQILEQPEYWLWTHRRWKRKRQPEETVIS